MSDSERCFTLPLSSEFLVSCACDCGLLCELIYISEIEDSSEVTQSMIALLWHFYYYCTYMYKIRFRVVFVYVGVDHDLGKTYTGQSPFLSFCCLPLPCFRRYPVSTGLTERVFQSPLKLTNCYS